MAGSRRAGSAVGVLSVEAAHHYARIYAAARAGCLAELRRAGCAEADAEDIFATTLERIMRKFDPSASTYGPAQTVSLLRKACLQKLIDERRHKDVLKLVPLEEASAKAREEAGPAEAVEEREAVAIGLEAIASLRERDRALFFQRHQLQLAPQEIVRRNPGLSERTYRKVIGRANTRVLRAYEEIEGGERCAQMSDGRLREFISGDGDADELAAVRRHLLRCSACRSDVARMRIHLHDVASGLAAVLAVEYAHGGFLTGHALAIWGEGMSRAEALLAGLRSGRGRLRELALKAATALPGSGGEASAGQIAGVSALKVTSACAVGAITVGCLAAGVVPDLGSHHRTRTHPAEDRGRPAPASPAASDIEFASPQASEAPTASPNGGEHRTAAARGGGGKVHRSSPAASSRPSGVQTESTSPVAEEFGVESAGTSAPPSQSPKESPEVSARPSRGTEISPSRSAGTGTATSENSSEFGL